MKILNDKLLANYVTMRIGGVANSIIEVSDEQQVIEAANWAKNQNLPLITIGQGSNIIFKDSGFSGLVIINKIRGLDIDAESGTVWTAAGENWDDVVNKSINSELRGIESLSLIPGTAGAAPVNNIGAYGQEIKDTLASLRAYDTKTSQFVEMANDECDFKYRDSRFKSYDHGRFIITSITLQLGLLAKDYHPPNYQTLNSKLSEQKILSPTPADIRRAVINIRQTKLPDPAKLPNTGSFFKNPIVMTEKVDELLIVYPSLPHFNYLLGLQKLAAGWLIEQADLKDYRQNGIWVYDKQALVLVNESAKSFNDLQLMINHIVDVVKNKFDILLEIEPEIF